VRVLYVGGTGRSGSTVLANVLGELPGMVSVGEVRFLWERGILENRLCGCGEPFGSCPFWTEVVRRTLGDVDAGERAETARRVHAEIHDTTRLRSLPRFLARAGEPAPGARTADLLPRLYDAIADVSGADVVVDSSKLPTYARLLADLPGIEVSVAHLVRDPRGAAFSWRRTKEQPDRGGFMEQRGVGKSAALWSAWNYGLERLFHDEPGRYARTTYEELLTAPERHVRTLLATLGMERDTSSVFADETTVRLSVNHTVAGNPARHRHGLVPMRLDDEWRTAMPVRDRRLVTAMTYPLLRRYGFPREAGQG